MPDFFTGILLRVPTMGERVLTLRRKGKAKRFTITSSPLALTHLSYSVCHVVEISTPIGSHVPPQSNFPGNINPWFR